MEIVTNSATPNCSSVWKSHPLKPTVLLCLYPRGDTVRYYSPEGQHCRKEITRASSFPSSTQILHIFAAVVALTILKFVPRDYGGPIITLRVSSTSLFHSDGFGTGGGGCHLFRRIANTSCNHHGAVLGMCLCFRLIHLLVHGISVWPQRAFPTNPTVTVFPVQLLSNGFSRVTSLDFALIL